MNAGALPLLVALVAAIVLVIQVPARLFPIIALVGCGFEVLRALGILSLKLPVIAAPLLFGAAMVVGGVGSWVKAPGKLPVTAATVVALVGLERLLTRLL